MNKSTSLVKPTEQQRKVAKAIDDAFHTQLSKANKGMPSISLTLAYADWAMHLAASPGQQLLLAQQAMALGKEVIGTAMQAETPALDADGKPVREMDPRFTDTGWSKWPFNVMKDSFKASDTWWRQSTEVDGLSPHSQHLVNFYTRQKLDALAPSNFALTNPEVLRVAKETQGQSWIKGYQNYVKDMQAAQKARHASDEADKLQTLDYEVAKDVAISPGKVVYRNHLIELIQYTPTTAKVYPEPLLIVPSNIMKYYILDLSPENSMVRYLVGQGHTVFMISWRNPDASDRDIGMQDYLQMGVMQAMAEVKTQTKAPRIHTMGYCLGGTFLAIVAAALGHGDGKSHRQVRGQNPHRREEDATSVDSLPELASVMLLAAQTEFSEPGELGVFIDDDQLNSLKQAMARTGYLSGRQMAGSFQFMNSRDLIWARNTRRYLLGMDEVGNDMMSWNADLTRLPERMHNEYLSSLFLNNALASGHYRVGGVGVTLGDIKAPMLVVGTVRDSVSPWQSVYKIHQLTETQITFVLAAGGHNAGIISEPGHARRSYQIACTEKGAGWIEPDAWVAKAPLVEGSWWEAMHTWLEERSGKPVTPPKMDPANVLCDAPGEYIMVRYAD